MAVPAIPTAVSLATEGLRQARIFSPSPAQVSLYSNEVMEQLKNTLWTELKQAKPLMTFSYAILQPGQSRYSCPSDFSSDMTMVILTGLTTGQAVSGGANILVVPPSTGALSADQTIGKDLVITSGSASSSVSQIVSVVPNDDGTTTLSVYPNWQATPDATSTFMIADNQHPVEADHIANYDKFRSSGLSRPRRFFSMGDEDFDEFIFDVPPDDTFTYCVRMRYFVNVMNLDLASPLMTSLYLKFRDYWIQGVKAQALADNDDTTADAALHEAGVQLQKLVLSQQYGTDIRTLRQHVEDYM